MGIYSLSDIININKLIGASGTLINKSSLEFALRASKNLPEHLVRSIVTDHAFEDGNKRTAFILLEDFYDDMLDRNNLVAALVLIATEQIQDIGTIKQIINECK